MGTTNRNSTIEFFRCLLMFLIVLGHSFCHGIWCDETGWWTLAFSTLIVWHVDGFVSISGWFGIKFSLKKLIRLWGLCTFYTFVGAAYQLAFERPSFSIKSLIVHGGWFTGTYMMLMMLAPILNAGIERLFSMGKKELLGAWLAFALGMVANWAPAHLMTGMNVGGAHDYSILTLVFVYVTARCARVLKVDRMPITRLLAVPVVFTGMIFLLGGAQQAYTILKGGAFEPANFRYWTVYGAPHVVLMAVFMLLMFVSRIKFPDFIGRVAVFCAPSMFGVYLMSDTTAFGPLLYRIPQKWFSTTDTPWLVVLITALTTFLICLVFDIVRHYVVCALERVCKL